MPAGHVEEARHIGNIFAALVAFPGQPAVQPELPALAYGADGANVSHALLLTRTARSRFLATLAADGVLAKIDAEDTPP